jgi:hypothetical protein
MKETRIPRGAVVLFRNSFDKGNSTDDTEEWLKTGSPSRTMRDNRRF